MNQDKKRDRLISELIDSNALKTERIISAFRSVRREDFVLEKYRDYAYIN